VDTYDRYISDSSSLIAQHISKTIKNEFKAEDLRSLIADANRRDDKSMHYKIPNVFENYIDVVIKDDDIYVLLSAQERYVFMDNE
jgi:hypothetical protein